jgi:hypothetical protein
MTSKPPSAAHNPAKLRAAFTLQQHAARMSRSLAAAVLLLTATAHAQTGTGTGTGATTTCTAGAMMASLGLVVPFNGASHNVATTSNGTVFDTAECQCQTNDIQLQIQVTAAYPQSMAAGQLEIFVGPSCDNQLNRTNGTCQQLTGLSLDFMSFVNGVTQTSTYLNVNIPSGPLFNPNNAGSANCPLGQILVNNFYMLFAPPGVDITTMPQVCSITLGQNLQTPLPVTGVSVSAGDTAVTLSWTAPTGVGEQVPFEYQILCADADGNPIGKDTSVRAYSVCLDPATNNISRRTNYVTASGTGTVTDDGGVTNPDLGMKVPINPPPEPEDVHTEAAPDDGGAQPITNSDFAKTLDPAFICSGEIKPTGLNITARVDGLVNHQTYQFVILAVDQNGNAIASPVLVGTPQPTEDLYTRYRDAGGTASGFCFIATAAFGSYEDRYVRVLRDFRDEVLLPNAVGRDIVDWYYTTSPPLAHFIEQHYWARVGTQMLLWPVIGVAALVTYTSPWEKALLCTLLVAFLLRRRFAKAVRA